MTANNFRIVCAQYPSWIVDVLFLMSVTFAIVINVNIIDSTMIFATNTILDYETVTFEGPFEANLRKPIQGDAVLHIIHGKPKLGRPILSVSFPKTGTSSLFNFFHCNGLKSQHWLCCEPQEYHSGTRLNRLMSRCAIENLILDRPLFENCGDYEVYAEFNGQRRFEEFHRRTLLDDGRLLALEESPKETSRLFFPQHHHLDRIHKHYPSATLVLTLRPVEAWVESVMMWDDYLPYEILNEFYEQNTTRFLFEKVGNTDTNKHKVYEKGTTPFTPENIRKNLGLVYRYHSDFVRKWVHQHPSHTLLEVNITDKAAGKKISEAFGLKEECWGHTNSNYYKKKGAPDMNATTSLSSSSSVSISPDEKDTEDPIENLQKKLAAVAETKRRQKEMRIYENIVGADGGEVNIRESLQKARAKISALNDGVKHG